MRGRFVLSAVLILLLSCVAGCAQETVVPDELLGKSVAMLVAEGFHSQETVRTMDYLAARGATVTLAGLAIGQITAVDTSMQLTVALLASEVDIREFDALVIPGGTQATWLSYSEDVLELTRRAAKEGKIIAAICRGPLVLAKAGVVSGYKISCADNVVTWVSEAGGLPQSRGFTQDRNLITARDPLEIDRFRRAIAQALKGAP